MPNDVPEFEVTRYGPGTERIRDILVAGRRIRWFPSRGPADAVEESLVSHHLAALASFFPGAPWASGPITWVPGSLEDFDHLGPAVQPAEGWGDPYGPTPWGRLLLKLHRDVLEQIESDQAILGLVGPPIWPLSRRPNVTTEALYEAPPDPEFRAHARWAMLEHVQHNYWRTLDWALLWPEGLDRSPFQLLFRLHLSGLYPTGFDEAGRFRVFYRNTTASESAAA
jgi:hypothetical protein